MSVHISSRFSVAVFEALKWVRSRHIPAAQIGWNFIVVRSVFVYV